MKVTTLYLVQCELPYPAGGSQQGAVLFPAQTLQLVTVLLQNCRHTHQH